MPYAPPLPLPEPAGPLPQVPAHVSSIPIHEVDWFMAREQEASTEALAHRWDPSGTAGVQRLEAFLQAGLPSFEHDRAKTDRESTTMLSPWIHFGCISVRHIYYRVAQKHAEWQAAGLDQGKSCLDFLQQMGYREYSRYLAFHFPFITERSMLAHLRAVPWRLDQAAFKAWRQGLTGYPLVDAGMRQLWSMGWCHNRVRVVASHFMVKHLLLPWQWGLKHLWDCQIDADLECDALGWQYVSGCLSDAHPFNYMIDMEEEWKRFDPNGNYVRRWLPVLSQLPTEYIHQPWKAPPEVLEEAGVELGFNYPWPIITSDAAKEGVSMAAAVVERCATSSGNSGSSSATAYNSVLPHKEPYRPPTDPALMSSFLAASRESPSWQEKLPPLYIHSATGHPLSLKYSAQQRPMWGPSLYGRSNERYGHDHMGQYYGLHRGRMGQQQMLLGPAAAAAGVHGALLRQQPSSGSYTDSESPPTASFSFSQGLESETGDNSTIMEEDINSGSGTEDNSAVRGRTFGMLGQHRWYPPSIAAASACSSEQQVVPSANEGLSPAAAQARAGWAAAGPQQHAARAAGRGRGQYPARPGGKYQHGGYADVDTLMDGDYADDNMTDSYAGPAMSLTTACSGFRGPVTQAGQAASEGQGEDNAGQMEEVSEGGGAVAAVGQMVAEVARLEQLQIQAGGQQGSL
eukprot:GHRR01003413.1.p1 GENE.GHRR01003413.1~~GHRR01003413.1.p1  ORF type:complete len:685 (+),score=262.21 GHRR01003413.1:1217-3271(+)